MNFTETTMKALGQTPSSKQIEMRKLHQDALDLIENTENTKSIQNQLNTLINKMEVLTTQPNKTCNFEEGGIHN